VHLQGLRREDLGLVESSGPGHKLPLDNLCNVNRPGKPANSAACVEIWSGTTLEIDSTNGHKGEVNADTGQAGGNDAGAGSTSWRTGHHDPGQCDGAGGGQQ
jgi:hypothetical protein